MKAIHQGVKLPSKGYLEIQDNKSNLEFLFSEGRQTGAFQQVDRDYGLRWKIITKRTVEDIIEIGRELTVVKADLPHGQFLPWIAAEFEMSQQTLRSESPPRLVTAG